MNKYCRVSQYDMLAIMFRIEEEEFSSVASHPFMTFIWVENNAQITKNYTIQVSYSIRIKEERNKNKC